MRAPAEPQTLSSMTGQAADHVQNLPPVPDTVPASQGQNNENTA